MTIAANDGVDIGLTYRSSSMIDTSSPASITVQWSRVPLLIRELSSPPF